jgi:hypothetical protein
MLMDSVILEQLAKQRETLKAFLQNNMSQLAALCSTQIHNQQALDEILQQHAARSTHCRYLWVLDHTARQLTATVSRHELREEQRGRDRVARPYMQRALKGEPFSLSEAYISRNRKRPSLTSVQTIVDENGKTTGFLGADFDLRELPHTAKLNLDKQGWLQMKGDPSIRGGLFNQSRTHSVMDEKIDDVLSLMLELIIAHGIFHAKLHFSSNRATVWLVDDPYSYQILNIDELTDASLCLAFPMRDYFEKARVPEHKLSQIFEQFKKLRFADENIYLRAASLNIVNRKVGLNFSCDGSHYVDYDEFLQKDNSFWFGVKN